MNRTLFLACLLSTSIFLQLLATPAIGYIGPGAGLSAIGALLALIAAAVLAIIGFLWYPLKRLLRTKKNENRAQNQTLEQEKMSADQAQVEKKGK